MPGIIQSLFGSKQPQQQGAQTSLNHKIEQQQRSFKNSESSLNPNISSPTHVIIGGKTMTTDDLTALVKKKGQEERSILRKIGNGIKNFLLSIKDKCVATLCYRNVNRFAAAYDKACKNGLGAKFLSDLYNKQLSNNNATAANIATQSDSNKANTKEELDDFQKHQDNQLIINACTKNYNAQTKKQISEHLKSLGF